MTTHQKLRTIALLKTLQVGDEVSFGDLLGQPIVFRVRRVPRCRFHHYWDLGRVTKMPCAPKQPHTYSGFWKPNLNRLPTLTLVRKATTRT